MDKERLTRGGAGPAGLPEGDAEVEIDGKPELIHVRAMNRGELLHGGTLNEKHGQKAMERYILSACMLDPTMTLEDVDAWMSSGPAMECQPVVKKINELSGVGKDAAKSDVHADGDD